MDRHEMRLDPLTGSWTIFSEARGQRLDFGPVTRDEFAPDPFIAGLEHYAPHTLHEAAGAQGWQVRVTPNRVPLLRVEGDATRRGEGFYDRMDGVGAHEVIIEDPGTRAFDELPLADVEKVIEAWKARMLDLSRDTRMRAFVIFKNVGRAAGSHVAHSVSQLVGLAIVPPRVRRKLEAARDFFAAKKRSVFEDILAEEVRAGTRLVYQNNGFTVFCPYASRVPFELAVYPKRQCADFHGITHEERAQLADALRSALRRLNGALASPPYNLVLTTAPTRTGRADYWGSIDQDFRWHIEILPRLHHVGGFEVSTGCWINGVWPEVAADYLRSVPLGE